MNDYHGYSYLGLLDNRFIQAVWKRVFCPIGWHMWDEVLSGVHEHHYLSCDACGLAQDLACPPPEIKIEIKVIYDP
jgi:hypothetical protein